MKILAALVVALFSALAVAAPDNAMVVRSQDGSAAVFLLNEQCDAEEVLKHIPPPIPEPVPAR